MFLCPGWCLFLVWSFDCWSFWIVSSCLLFSCWTGTSLQLRCGCRPWHPASILCKSLFTYVYIWFTDQILLPILACQRAYRAWYRRYCWCFIPKPSSVTPSRNWHLLVNFNPARAFSKCPYGSRCPHKFSMTKRRNIRACHFTYELCTTVPKLISHQSQELGIGVTVGASFLSPAVSRQAEIGICWSISILHGRFPNAPMGVVVHTSFPWPKGETSGHATSHMNYALRCPNSSPINRRYCWCFIPKPSSVTPSRNWHVLVNFNPARAFSNCPYGSRCPHKFSMTERRNIRACHFTYELCTTVPKLISHQSQELGIGVTVGASFLSPAVSRQAEIGICWSISILHGRFPNAPMGVVVHTSFPWPKGETSGHATSHMNYALRCPN